MVGEGRATLLILHLVLVLILNGFLERGEAPASEGVESPRGEFFVFLKLEWKRENEREEEERCVRRKKRRAGDSRKA